MSLLEDVFLEDEAGEANELERIIEGDGFDERPRSEASNSDNESEKEDEAEEDKRRVDPSQAKPKRVVKNPRFILNPARLTGPRGIQVIPEHFKDFKFKGKGHEREDLDLVLKKLEHWAYRLYPKFQFEDCLKKIETLGKKRPVMVHLHKIRTDQFTNDERVVQKDSSDDEEAAPQQDEFDILLQQQIDLARATPAPESARKLPPSTPAERSLMMPKATSSPSINDEQRERMLRNRKLAEERRLARLKQTQTQDNKENNVQNDSSNINDNHKKFNKSSVINSSDEEDNVNKSVTVEIHNNQDIVSKTNKSNVIESSDDEENVTNHSITVQIHNNKDNINNAVSKNNNKPNVINSSDEDDNVNSLDNNKLSNNVINDNQNEITVQTIHNQINISNILVKESVLNDKDVQSVDNTNLSEPMDELNNGIDPKSKLKVVDNNVAMIKDSIEENNDVNHDLNIEENMDVDFTDDL